MQKMQDKCRRSRSQRAVCVRLGNRNAHGQVARAIACENLQEKCRAPRTRHTRACAVDVHMDMSQELFYTRIFKKNAAPQERKPYFVRACAVECTWTCRKSNFTGKKPKPDGAPWSSTGLYLWINLLGKKKQLYFEWSPPWHVRQLFRFQVCNCSDSKCCLGMFKHAMHTHTHTLDKSGSFKRSDGNWIPSCANLTKQTSTYEVVSEYWDVRREDHHNGKQIQVDSKKGYHRTKNKFRSGSGNRVCK